MSSSTPHTMESLLSTFQSLSLTSTKTVAHIAAPTCEAHSEALAGTALDPRNDSSLVQAKNLFVKVPSKGGPLKDRLFLLIADVKTDIDVKKVSTRLGVKPNAPLRLASEDVFDKVLQVPRGSVTPFVMANDSVKSGNVVLLLDEKFRGKKGLFHPMRNDYTTSIESGELEKFLNQSCGAAKWKWVDFSPAGEKEIDLFSEEFSVVEKNNPGEVKKPKKITEEPKKKDNDFTPPERKVKEQMFASQHLFTVKKVEDTIWKTAFLKKEWVKV